MESRRICGFHSKRGAISCTHIHDPCSPWNQDPAWSAQPPSSHLRSWQHPAWSPKKLPLWVLKEKEKKRSSKNNFFFCSFFLFVFKKRTSSVAKEINRRDGKGKRPLFPFILQIGHNFNHSAIIRRLTPGFNWWPPVSPVREGRSWDEKHRRSRSGTHLLSAGGVTSGPDLVTAATHPQRVKRVGSLWQNTETGKQRPVVKRGLKKKG